LPRGGLANVARVCEQEPLPKTADELSLVNQLYQAGKYARTVSTMGSAKMKHLFFASLAFLTLIAVAAVITAAD
jgi:hypothetical protein